MHPGLRVRHKSKPQEPFSKEGEFGTVIRVTPAARMIPAQCYVDWETCQTWERQSDLVPVITRKDRSG
jgi:hypothetical protein